MMHLHNLDVPRVVEQASGLFDQITQNGDPERRVGRSQYGDMQRRLRDHLISEIVQPCRTDQNRSFGFHCPFQRGFKRGRNRKIYDDVRRVLIDNETRIFRYSDGNRTAHSPIGRR